MRATPAPGSPAPGGLVGTVRSSLRSWWSEVWQSSADQRSGAAGADARSRSSIRVLVVDDDPMNLMVMSALMASKGLVPLLAADGAKAVTLACEMRFDLILMDLQMPIFDGLEATAAIRRFETTCSRLAVPVVAYSSAFLGAGDLAAHGMNGRLVKPCDDQDLEDCLVRWCPSYLSSATVRGVRNDNGRGQAMDRNPGSSSAWLR